MPLEASWRASAACVKEGVDKVELEERAAKCDEEDDGSDMPAAAHRPSRTVQRWETICVDTAQHRTAPV